MSAVRYYVFALRWLWRNRTWQHSRQKYKALDREWREYEARRGGAK